MQQKFSFVFYADCKLKIWLNSIAICMIMHWNTKACIISNFAPLQRSNKHFRYRNCYQERIALQVSEKREKSLRFLVCFVYCYFIFHLCDFQEKYIRLREHYWPQALQVFRGKGGSKKSSLLTGRLQNGDFVTLYHHKKGHTDNHFLPEVFAWWNTVSWHFKKLWVSSLI